VAHGPTEVPQRSKQPRTADPGPPDNSSLARTTARPPTSKEARPSPIVQQANGNTASPPQVRWHGKAPVAFASQAAPAGRRKRYGLFYGCPHCGANHIGFSWVKVTSCKRTSGCGRVIWLVVKRNYRGDADAAGAA
jgi:hypothetical protein